MSAMSTTLSVIRKCNQSITDLHFKYFVDPPTGDFGQHKCWICGDPTWGAFGHKVCDTYYDEEMDKIEAQRLADQEAADEAYFGSINADWPDDYDEDRYPYDDEYDDDFVSYSEVYGRAARCFPGNPEQAHEAATMYPGDFI